MTPIGRALWLAIGNLLVIALGMSGLDGGRDRFGVFTLVCLIGIIPALLTAVALGKMAGKMTERAPLERTLALAVPAFLVVIVLGFVMGMFEFILVSMIPTLVAVILLERGTRVAKPELVPVATARDA